LTPTLTAEQLIMAVIDYIYSSTLDEVSMCSMPIYSFE